MNQTDSSFILPSPSPFLKSAQFADDVQLMTGRAPRRCPGGRMGLLTLVLGGARSGKSRFAEQRAAAHTAVIYLATARPGDAALAERIARHQERRAPLGWRTVEEPWDVVEVLCGGTPPEACVLLECLTLWVTNLLLGLPGRDALDDAAVAARVAGLAEAAAGRAGPLIVVSSEVGCGIIPDNALARRFGDVLGDANQRLATAAAEVHVCWAGIPVRIK
jgi:adenosylcobinamide kinase/adenosylcobinamide-phosphate guanylyltransferase